MVRPTRKAERRKPAGDAPHGGAGAGRTRAIDFNALVWRTITRTRSTAGGSPMCAASLDPALAPVKVDPDQMERVVRELLAEALDALPAGACLLVETGNVPVGDPELRRQDSAKVESFVRLAVHDMRQGDSAPARAPRPFPPSPTTALIRRFGGFLRLESHSDGGSSLRMYLPQAARARPSTPAGTGEASDEMI
jgi:two-component system, cell cycle sensor histidine kinase and response regulator CckA